MSVKRIERLPDDIVRCFANKKEGKLFLSFLYTSMGVDVFGGAMLKAEEDCRVHLDAADIYFFLVKQFLLPDVNAEIESYRFEQDKQGEKESDTDYSLRCFLRWQRVVIDAFETNEGKDFMALFYQCSNPRASVVFSGDDFNNVDDKISVNRILGNYDRYRLKYSFYNCVTKYMLYTGQIVSEGEKKKFGFTELKSSADRRKLYYKTINKKL